MPNTHPIKLPTARYLRICLDYDPNTGELRWKRRSPKYFIKEKRPCWNNKNAGKTAGVVNNTGRIAIMINGRKYLAHRIIYKMMTGKEPPPTIDHRDRDPSDNRWEQLRPATRAQQNFNRPVRRDSLSGYRGVGQQPNGRWYARINRRHLGVFSTPEEASQAYKKAARALHGEFFFSEAAK